MGAPALMWVVPAAVGVLTAGLLFAYNRLVKPPSSSGS
jgi:hypothetical protein